MAAVLQAILSALAVWPDEPRWHALAAEIYLGGDLREGQSDLEAAIDKDLKPRSFVFPESLRLDANLDLERAVNASEPQRAANADPAAAPCGVFRCRGKDEWCAVSVSTDLEWAGFCRAVGGPDWSSDKQYATVPGRKENEDKT
jgi:hypothetical protein